jgi:CheY-like chemotaxis protein
MEGNETILFVDDEEYLAEVGKEMLEDYGYEVDIETDSARALNLFKADPDRYHLMVSDYTMPGMKGDELVSQIHAVRPHLPVILCSGTHLDAGQVEKSQVSKVLLKPFDMDVLISAVREVLDGGVSG